MNTIYTINSCNSVTNPIKKGLLFLLKEWKALLLIVLIGASGSFVATAQTNETVTNKTVIQLCKAGIGKSIIIAKIESSTCNFDLSTDGLVQLKKGAVPDDIVTEMIAKSNAPAMPSAPAPGLSNMPAGQNGNPELALQPGVYYLNPGVNDYTALNPGLLADQQVAETATYKMRSLISGKIRGDLSGLQANQKINDPNPVFVIVMDMTGQNPNVPNLSDPGQLVLARLKQVRNNRELVIGRATPSGNVKGVEENAKVNINFKKVQDNLYEVSANAPLTTGEYSLVYALPDNNGQSIVYQSFDFSLKGVNNPVAAGPPRDPRADRPPPPNPLDIFRKKAKKDTTNNGGN